MHMTVLVLLAMDESRSVTLLTERVNCITSMSMDMDSFTGTAAGRIHTFSIGRKIQNKHTRTIAVTVMTESISFNMIPK